MAKKSQTRSTIYSMSYNIIPTENFSKEVKRLARKYNSLKNDLLKLKDELQANPQSGVHLGNNIYKIRMPIGSKRKGKSGGARVISYVYIQNEQIFLLTIFDKSEKENISDSEIKGFIKNLKENNLL
jgi:hypothetical protein